jgi:putative copper export protein
MRRKVNVSMRSCSYVDGFDGDPSMKAFVATLVAVGVLYAVDKIYNDGPQSFRSVRLTTAALLLGIAFAGHASIHSHWVLCSLQSAFTECGP